MGKMWPPPLVDQWLPVRFVQSAPAADGCILLQALIMVSCAGRGGTTTSWACISLRVAFWCGYLLLWMSKVERRDT